MSYDAHANFAYSTVAVAPSPELSGTSLEVASGQGALFPTAPFNCTVWPAGTTPLASNAEIIRVTSVVGDTFTITRGQESTLAIAIVAGFQISNSISNLVFTQIEAEIAAAAASSQPLDTTLTELAALALVQGDILYRNATVLTRLPAGTAGQSLVTGGAGANPAWGYQGNIATLPAGGGAVAIDLTGADYQLFTLDQNLSLTTTNRGAGRSKTMILTCDGTPRNLTFPAWIWIGDGAPTSIPAGKKAVISVTCLGNNETDVIAVYSDENP